MSGIPAQVGELLTKARAYATRGEWAELRTSLARSSATTGDPELGLLSAEAEMRLGNPRAASEQLGQVLPVLEVVRRPVLLRRSLNLLGAVHLALGDLALAEPVFERALALALDAQDDLLAARATNNLGASANIRGCPDEALLRYRRCLLSYQRLGSDVGIAETLHNMAITYRDLHEYETADDCERRAIEHARIAGSAKLTAMARTARAELSLLRGDPRLAVAGARIAAKEFATIQDRTGEADAFRLEGAAQAELGSTDNALAALDRSVALAHAHGSALIEAEALRVRAGVHASKLNLEHARADAMAAHFIFDRLGARAERDAMDRYLAGLDTDALGYQDCNESQQ